MTFDNCLATCRRKSQTLLPWIPTPEGHLPEKHFPEISDPIFSLQPIGTCSKNMYLFQTLPYSENKNPVTGHPKAYHD